ncbi:MAG: zinc ribbon domain-containing protein, partial [Syntrophobacteraceae bacterium]
QLPEWCLAVPYQVKAMAVKEAVQAFWKGKGHPDFRSRKNPEQSCYIPKSAITEAGIYYTVSGRGLRFLEALPEGFLDSRLIWRFGKWWMAIPYKTRRTYHNAENQGRVVSLDPGIRSFMTFYSPDFSGKIGSGDFSRIQRLCSHLDGLISRRDLSKNKQQRRSMSRAAMRMRAKIKHLISELHFKTAKFLTDNFDVILLPTFESSNMVSKSRRKIGKKSIRSMLTFAHYRFKQILKWEAFQVGKTVLDCDEAYTSKTHPETGEIRNIGSAKRIRLLNGSWADRDIVGARNILLRALSDSTFGFRAVAVNES